MKGLLIKYPPFIQNFVIKGTRIPFRPHPSRYSVYTYLGSSTIINLRSFCFHVYPKAGKPGVRMQTKNVLSFRIKLVYLSPKRECSFAVGGMHTVTHRFVCIVTSWRNCYHFLSVISASGAQVLSTFLNSGTKGEVYMLGVLCEMLSLSYQRDQ